MQTTNKKNKQILTQVQRDQQNARRRQLYAENKEKKRHVERMVSETVGPVLDMSGDYNTHLGSLPPEQLGQEANASIHETGNYYSIHVTRLYPVHFLVT